ncbi:hypothetical protein RND71_011824 [Anisodus tanguticus]|uniref:Uncharacterized protein n=1 Tax=Anisodus tanguticus TaxID=243964 RepID=A0AAE1VGE8_9SOLA|nr:hypothetical protein RND71_011824 [Anisodus tanguticus]
MRTLCPNVDKEDGLEVPIPDEMFKSMGSNAALRWQNMATWMKAQTSDKWSSPIIAARYNELSFLLYMVGSPLIPFQIQLGQSVNRPVKHSSIVRSVNSEIHIATIHSSNRGQPALNAVNSMCVIGAIKITASDFHQGDQSVKVRKSDVNGGFVLWQKNPDLWCLELLISGSKVIAGSNGKISWRQSSNQIRPISKGPTRPLRRFLQGLDPRTIANLFANAVCIGEKIINDEDCFILKLDTNQSALEAQSGPNYEILHHTIWGYFSQRSGLMIKFEDSRLSTVKTSSDVEGVFWETSTESVMEDYKYVDGVNVAHSGNTLLQFSDMESTLQTTRGSWRKDGKLKR